MLLQFKFCEKNSSIEEVEEDSCSELSANCEKGNFVQLEIFRAMKKREELTHFRGEYPLLFIDQNVSRFENFADLNSNGGGDFCRPGQIFNFSTLEENAFLPDSNMIKGARS